MLIRTILLFILIPFSSQQTVRTLLSLREHNSSKFVSALYNPLYKELRNKTISTKEEPSKATTLRGRRLDADIRDVLPHIWLDKREVSFGESLTLYWKNANDNDIIALYCPVDETDHKKFREAATIGQVRNKDRKMKLESQNQWYIPSFPIVREESCEFRYLERSYGEIRLLSHTHAPFLVQNGKIEPMGLHISQTISPTVNRIHFATGETGIPVVNYGKGTALDLFKEGRSQTYSAEDMCHAPATNPHLCTSPGMLHSVRLPFLTPNTEYSYRVGIIRHNKKNIFWSKIHSFTTSPPIGTFPVSILAYGDQGCPGASWEKPSDWEGGAVLNTVNASREKNIHAIHHLGDLAYAMGATHVWDAWLEMIQPFATRVPLMVIAGNHDYGYKVGAGPYHYDYEYEGKMDPSGEIAGYQPDWGSFHKNSGGECGVPISFRFDGSGYGNDVFWYAYNLGGIHFVMLSSEHDLSKNSRQYNWLQDNLKKVNRRKTPWLIVESHRPLYNSLKFAPDYEVGIHLRDEIEDLLNKYGVDVYLSGHYHSYFRSCEGLYKEKCNNGGPVFITVGTGGAEIAEWGILEQDWTEKILFEWGYGRLTALDENTLHWEFVRAQDMAVIDEVWIQKKNGEAV